MAGLGWQVVLLIAAVSCVGAVVQSVVGLGLGLLTAPVVALAAPALVPVLPLWLALLVSGLLVAGERHHVDWRALAWALPARVPGTVLGAWLVVRFSDTAIGVALGVMVLLAVAVSVHAVDVPVNRATLVTAGFVAGTSGTATSVGGPPIALLFQHARPEVVRSTLSVFFFVGVVLSLTGLAVSGSLDAASFRVALACAPGVVLGARLGHVVRGRLPREAFRRAVLVVCAASAAALLLRSLLG